MYPVCSICLLLFAPSDKMQATPCGHLFHPCCLKEWVQNKNNCPECRKSCVASNLIAIYPNCASKLDLLESEEPTILLAKINSLAEEVEQKSKILLSNSLKFSQLKRIVNNLEARLNKQDEWLSLQLAALSSEKKNKKLVKLLSQIRMQNAEFASCSANNKIPTNAICARTIPEDASILLLKNFSTNAGKSIYILLEPPLAGDVHIRHSKKSDMKVNIVMLDEEQSKTNSVHDHINAMLASMHHDNDDSIVVSNQSDLDKCFGEGSFDFFETYDYVLEQPFASTEDTLLQDSDNGSMDLAEGFDYSLFDVNPEEDPGLAEAIRASLQMKTEEEESLKLALKMSLETAAKERNTTLKQQTMVRSEDVQRNKLIKSYLNQVNNKLTIENIFNMTK